MQAVTPPGGATVVSGGALINGPKADKHTDMGKADAGKADAGKADAGKADASRACVDEKSAKPDAAHVTDMFVMLVARTKSDVWGEPELVAGSYQLYHDQLYAIQVYGDSKYDAYIQITIDDGAPIAWGLTRKESLLIKNTGGGLAFRFKALDGSKTAHGVNNLGTIRVEAMFGTLKHVPVRPRVESPRTAAGPRICQRGAGDAAAAADGSTHFEPCQDALVPTATCTLTPAGVKKFEWNCSLRLAK